MKQIPLTKGYFAIVDDEDFEALSKYAWRALVKKTRVYAVRKAKKPGLRAGTFMAMHRQVIDAPDGRDVDHIDRNPLNNTKANLRLCSGAENSRNTSRAPGKWGYRGVTFHKKGRERPFEAYIGFQWKKISLGYFPTAVAAAEAYNAAALKYHGEFATLNDLDAAPSPGETGNG